MKTKNLKIAQLVSLVSLLVVLGAGCNGGSSQQLVAVTSGPTPHPTATAIGPEPIHSSGPISPILPITGPTIRPISPILPNPIPTVCPVWGCNGPEPIYPVDPINTPVSISDSTDSGTRDTDLQQANLQSATLASRAQMLSTQFQMSVSAATQLAVLGDKVQLMTSQGQELSDADRDAITQSALSIAGVTSDEVNQAFQQSVAGDNSATDALVAKAAQNLGMPSSDNLRGQLLQALGVQLQ
jgi:hypothetical protein